MELEFCPFCGYRPDINDPDVCYQIKNAPASLWQVTCGNMDCGALMLGESKEEAIVYWNKRVVAK